MTDNEIMKALERLASGCFDCNDGCKQSSECPVNIISCAINLIKRQKQELADERAKIEALIFSIQSLSGFFKNAKSEAIKEFIKQLGKYRMLEDKNHITVVPYATIKAVADRMVGDENAL